MVLRDFQFILDPFQMVNIVEYDLEYNLVTNKIIPWYKVNVLNREVISLVPFGWFLQIEVKSNDK